MFNSKIFGHIKDIGIRIVKISLATKTLWFNNAHIS